MNPYDIIGKYYPTDSLATSFLIPHSEAVAEFAVEVGVRIGGVDLDFIREAALLHDIGIFLTKAPSIGCTGVKPYITHGILGEQLLQHLGYDRHATVCRTHVGVALTAEYIREKKLPLQAIDMVPQTTEELIVAYADKFFSKRPEWLTTAKPVERVIEEMQRFGDEPVAIFREWHERFR